LKIIRLAEEVYLVYTVSVFLQALFETFFCPSVHLDSYLRIMLRNVCRSSFKVSLMYVQFKP